MGEGLHMCHLQEGARRRWSKALCLGRLCLTAFSCLTWNRQSVGDHQGCCVLQRGSPIGWQKVSTNALQSNTELGQWSPASKQILGGAGGYRSNCVTSCWPLFYPRSFCLLSLACSPSCWLVTC